MLEHFPKPNLFRAIALRKRAQAFYNLKDYQKAAGDLSELVASGLATASDFSLRGNSYAWLGLAERAYADAKEAAERAPQNGTFQFQLAIAETDTGRNSEAVARLERLYRLYPRDVGVGGKLAQNYRLTGRDADALRIYKAVLPDATVYEQRDLWIGRGLAEYALGLLNDSETSFSMAILRDYDSDIAYSWRAKIRERLRDYQRAREDIALALTLSGRIEYRLQRVSIYLESGALQESQEELDAISKIPGAEAEKAYYRGRLAAAAGHHEAALLSYEAAARDSSVEASALYDSAVSLRELGRTREAEAKLTRVLQIAPKDTFSFLLRSSLRIDLGDYNGALADADAAEAAGSDSSETDGRRASAYNALLLFSKAEKSCRKVLAADPQNEEALVECAFAAWSLDGLDRTLADYDAMLKLRPDNPILLAERAEVLYQLDRPYEAMREAERAVKLAPSSATVLRHRGSIMRMDGRQQAAFSDFFRAIALGPDDGWNYEARAYWHLDRGEIVQAIADCRVMREKLPKAPAAFRCLARAAWNAGEAEDAVGWLDKAEAISPNYAAAAFDRALILKSRGEREAARDNLSKAIELGFQRTEALVLRGDIAKELGEPEAALRDYKNAQSLAPERRRKVIEERIAAIDAGRGSMADGDATLYPGRHHPAR